MRQPNRLVEVFVYAPLGAGLYLVDVAPSFLETLVARGRAEVDQRRETLGRHVTTARSTGHVVVAFGVPMLRERAGRLGTVAFSRAPEPEPTPASAAAPAMPTPVSPVVPLTANGAPHAVPCAELPIPGYDALSASQVVERLIGLAPAELDVVRDYETAHRNRRTILGKIDQLAAPPV
jgi:hypothetical protein